MRHTLYVGCPMWAQRAWVGRFLPEDTPTGRELHAYSRLLNAVEGNTTFYATPTPAVVARWRDQAQPGFRFVFKVPKHITHDRRLRGIATELTAFCQLMEPLGDLVGGFTLQLPASFGPEELGALEWALRQRSTAWHWSVEVRHAALFTGVGRASLNAMLGRYGVERVLLDTESLFSHPPITDAGREEWEQKPRVPVTPDSNVRTERLRRLSEPQRKFDALPVDDDVATSYGQLAAAVVSAGRQPQSRAMDLLIAATAHAHRARLYTRNAADLIGIEHLIDIVSV